MKKYKAYIIDIHKYICYRARIHFNPAEKIKINSQHLIEFEFNFFLKSVRIVM
jgi:hypothetical protein